MVPVLFFAASVILLYYSFRADVKYSLAEIGMIVAGVPFYLYFAAKRSAEANCLPVDNETLKTPRPRLNGSVSRCEMRSGSWKCRFPFLRSGLGRRTSHFLLP